MQDILRLAARMGVSSARLDDFLSKSGRMSFAAESSGKATSIESVATRFPGLPIGDDGAPDFDRIVAEGGTVKGGIPPAGLAKLTIVDNYGSRTFYAAEVTTGAGAPATFVKGLNLQANESNSRSENYDFASNALEYFNKLPNSAAEALSRSNENLFDIYGSDYRLDTSI